MKNETVKVLEENMREFPLSLQSGEGLSNDDSKSRSHRKKNKVDCVTFTWQNK